ncbi:MAG: ROK family protein [Myxococcota bacterium]|nr:ROK family protein [Myxococcota bacterium]MEE2779437.1 ROK family protein [Myxococcota bacterium]
MWIGIDVGGTSVKAGLVAGDDQVRERQSRPVGDRRSPDDILRLLQEIVSDLSASCSDIQGVGLAAPGVIDKASGVIRQSPNFPDWRDVALGSALARETGLQVSLENDVNAIAWAEHQLGAGAGSVSMVCIALGTGVGGGMILDGALWRGARGMAGELGHVTVATEGRSCPCGNLDCLEQYVGAVGIRRSLVQHGGRYAELAESRDAPRQLGALARAGDPVALDVFRGVGAHLGRAVTTYLHVLDVDRVVICGGIAAELDLFIDTVEKTVRAHSYAAMAAGMEVVSGALRGRAGILGAALVGMEGLERQH